MSEILSNTSDSMCLKDEFVCVHCENKSTRPYFQNNLAFCCFGCMHVYKILHEKGLDQYYSLKANSFARLRPASPVQSTHQNYSFMDTPEFAEKYLVKLNEHDRHIRFYVEGVHCLACLWLLEKLPEWLPGILRANLNLEKSLLDLIFDSQNVSLSQIAQELDSLGHIPHAISEKNEWEKWEENQLRQEMIRLGVAATVSGNLMLFSLGIYGGLTGPMAQHFGLFSALIFLPLLFYSSLPFFRSSWAALKKRQLNIDVPIALALLLGSGFSYFNLMSGNEELYFDTLSMLVFLLLFARFILHKMQKHFLDSSGELNFFQDSQVEILNARGVWEDISPEFVQIGDRIRIRPGQMVPFDGVLKSSEVEIQDSILTGEFRPKKCVMGDHLFSGYKNLGRELVLEVSAVGDETRLGKLYEKLKLAQNNPAQIVREADIWAKRLLSLSFFLSALCILYFSLKGEMALGFSRALSLIIVACPCALGLVTPFCMYRLMSKLSQQGILIKSEEKLEALAHMNHFFIDKTGTLTKGQFVVHETKSLDGRDYKDLIFSMELISHHPLAQGMVEYFAKLGARQLTELEEVSEVPGVGVKGFYLGDFFELKSAPDSASQLTSVGLYKNEQLVFVMELDDELRDDTKKNIEELNDLEVSSTILSGDKKSVVDKTAKILNIKYKAEVSPEDKALILAQFPQAGMVGDGANDSLAMANAKVGIAVQGSVELGLRASDIYFLKPGLSALVLLIKAARENLKIIRHNIFISFFYNLIGMSLALSGVITPLIAALLMPISSLTVLFLSVRGTKLMRSVLP